jgi:hypothetical protein
VSDTREPGDHGGSNDPEYRVGRGAPARRRIGALLIGVVLGIFAVLLSIWLLGSSVDDVEGAARASVGPLTLVVGPAQIP